MTKRFISKLKSVNVVEIVVEPNPGVSANRYSVYRTGAEAQDFINSCGCEIVDIRDLH